MKKNTHILKTDFGVTARLEFNEENGNFNCVWEGAPPLGKWPRDLLEKVMKVYLPWRNQILAEWAKRTTKTMLVIDI